MRVTPRTGGSGRQLPSSLKLWRTTVAPSAATANTQRRLAASGDVGLMRTVGSPDWRAINCRSMAPTLSPPTDIESARETAIAVTLTAFAIVHLSWGANAGEHGAPNDVEHRIVNQVRMTEHDIAAVDVEQSGGSLA